MICKFLPGDTEQVMQIWLNGNIEAHHFVPRAYWESNASAVREQLLEADVYVYKADGKVMGFVGMQGNYLAGIFVDKAARSMGIGKKLLDYVKEIYPAFSLNVYQENKLAVAFYQREGLTVISEGLDEDTGHADYKMTWKKDGLIK